MSANTVVLIVVIAMIVLLLGACAWVARDRRDKRRRAEADSIPRQAHDEKRRVTLHEARAEETAAKGRVAQAHADVEADRARTLPRQAVGRHRDPTNSRDGLDRRFARADAPDPDSPRGHRA